MAALKQGRVGSTAKSGRVTMTSPTFDDGLNDASANSSGTLFGVLQPTSAKAPTDVSAGITVAGMETGWNVWETADGVFSASFEAQRVAELQTYLSNGMKVFLTPDLHYPPSWLLALANTQDVNQLGHASGTASFAFSQTVRTKAAAYLTRIGNVLGWKNIWGIRIGGGGQVESGFPYMNVVSGDGSNQYWGYNANAQGNATDRPSSVPVCPFKGTGYANNGTTGGASGSTFWWSPGETQYQGAAFTAGVGSNTETWFNWYIAALADVINWQMSTLRGLGYTGYFMVDFAGLGIRPSEYGPNLTNRLNGTSDTNSVMGRACVFHKLSDLLNNDSKIILHCSSVWDTSGSSLPDSQRIPNSSDILRYGPNAGNTYLTSSDINSWASQRWIAFLADRKGWLKGGENPSHTDSANNSLGQTNYNRLMLQGCMESALSGSYVEFCWAFEADLYKYYSLTDANGTGVTLSDYADAIRHQG